MARFNGFDIDGNICEVQEYGNDMMLGSKHSVFYV